MDNLKTVKDYILKNRDKINLSFYETVIKENVNSSSHSKVKYFENSNNKSLQAIIPFYKKMTRLL